MQTNRWFSWLWNGLRLLGRGRHHRLIRQAVGTLDVLAKIAAENPVPDVYRPRILAYLRKIDPFVFEELVLTVIERSNAVVTRNTRYTSDGGVDGRFHLVEGDVLIQCKRYGSHIDRKHLEVFRAQVAPQRAIFGVFIHTGRTGDLARSTAQATPHVGIVSGGLLVDVLLGRASLATFVRQRLARQAAFDRTCAVPMSASVDWAMPGRKRAP
jgi:restriction system protein